MIERATNVFGPYTESKQLNHADKQAKEPNQGGLVQTEQGGWYWFTHHGTGDYDGRCASLLPVTWIADWPIIGKVGADGIGSMVWSGKNPVVNAVKVTPQTSDEFDETNLPPQWEWNYQPRAEKWSLTERRGWLRLHAFPPLRPGDFFKAGNTLTQRIMGTGGGEVMTKLDVTGMADGQTAGLCVFWKKFCTLGVRQENGVRKIELNNDGLKTAFSQLNSSTTNVWFKATIDNQGSSTFAWSLNGKNFTAMDGSFKFGWGNYRGTRIGVYSYNDEAVSGFVDVDWFHYAYAGSPQTPK
jgi:beta-xylosidase